MRKLSYNSIESAKEYIEGYLKENPNLTLADLLKEEYKEFRLMMLLSIRPLLSDSLLKKYDYNEQAIFTTVFFKPVKYVIPEPMMLPEVTLSKQEQTWYNKLLYASKELEKRLEKNTLKDAGVDINALQNSALKTAAMKIAKEHGYDVDFAFDNTVNKVFAMAGITKIDKNHIKEKAIHDKVVELGFEGKIKEEMNHDAVQLQNTRVAIAYTLINMNSQISLTNIKNMYCYAVNQDGIDFDNESLIQIATILAMPLIPDRVKKEELLCSDRIFFRTFLPDYYEKRYKPLDELDFFYCLNADIFRTICRMSEVKVEETKWQKNSNGLLVDTLCYESLEKYMDKHNIEGEEKIKCLCTPGLITTESPVLSIYGGRKKMAKAAKLYGFNNLSFTVKTNFGRQYVCSGYDTVQQYNEDGTPKYHTVKGEMVPVYKKVARIYTTLYDHLVDAYMIIKSKTSLEGRQFCKKHMDTYLDCRDFLKLPEVPVLTEYRRFKQKQATKVSNTR